MLASCSDEDPIPSSTTFYPDFEVLEGIYYRIPINSTFTDPGVIATEAGEVIEYTVTGEENVDSSTPGVYRIDYTAVNKDGFSGTGSRWVIVSDYTPDGTELTGIYDLNVSFLTTMESSVAHLDQGVFSMSSVYGYEVTYNCCPSPGRIAIISTTQVALLPEFDPVIGGGDWNSNGTISAPEGNLTLPIASGDGNTRTRVWDKQ